MRTGGIAIVLASIATVIRLHHWPASAVEWYGWLVLFLAVTWFSFGGHWVELVYLNGLRPRIARWPDASLVVVRLAVWLIGGAMLALGAVATRSLLTANALPGHSLAVRALLYGGPIFIGVEWVAHAVLLLRGRPSFWNLRG